jgi:uncharacterized repeat protein (TIGR01451 family)
MDYCGLFLSSRNHCAKPAVPTSRGLAKALLVISMLLICGTPLWAQSPGYADFSSAAHLSLNGNAAAPESVGSRSVLRLNPADFSQHGSAWFDIEQPLTNGFNSVFTFQITDNPELPGHFPADGLAFVIQGVLPEGYNNAVQALGDGGGGIGYQGIPNSLAIEFDTFLNPGGPDHVPNNDPDANHVGVQSCGLGPNSADHGATFGNQSCNYGLVSLQTPTLADGEVHTVTINYHPAAPNCSASCSPHLFVNLDGTELFPSGIAVDLSTLLTLDGGKGIVGFTGGTGALFENNDILSWSFTPHTSTTISQTIMPGVTSVFTFGEFNYKITPDLETNNSPDTLTVTAVPIDPSNFVPGPNFPGAVCIPYAGNNGKCSEFHVTCSGPDCNTGTYQVALNWDSASPGTPPPNTARGLLDAPDQDCPPPANYPFTKNIFTGFQATRVDPVIKGAGGPRYSCFVAVQNVTYGNADLAVLNLATSSKVKAGGSLSYAIGLTNFGPNTANGVNITDQLDPNTTFVSGTVAQTTCTFLLHGLTCTKPVTQACTAVGQTVTCPVGVLAPTSLQSVTAAAAQVFVSVSSTACSSGTCPTLRNVATVSAINPDPKPKTNTSTATTQVVR